MNIHDYYQRQRALNPSQSFIVQAPAGSGKTELLVRRYLVLLAHARQAPEEIIAITFTRKAAAEMRHRVIEALKLATLPPPDDTYRLQTWEIAHAALMQDTRLKWNLLNNPNRLRIQTIDSLCLHLTHQMPLLSGFGTRPNILEDASDFYLETARTIIANLEEKNSYSEALTELLLHLDNQIEHIENLFVRMLGSRDQWLPYLMVRHKNPLPDEFKKILENGLQNIASEVLAQCQQNIPADCLDELLTLLHFASENMQEINQNSFISKCKDLCKFQKSSTENHLMWLGITELLLTQEHTWRTKIDKRIGFPPENKPMKLRMMSLINSLHQNKELRKSLQTLRECPPLSYTGPQWSVIKALSELLPLLVAELHVLFQERGVVDFNEVGIAALRALGEEQSPTELALILDYQIQHILIDEFQDTSTMQFRLLEKLTNGWQMNDGRTIFLVGDPMQSIYRFREAEVGLFLKAEMEGIGHIKLEALQLNTNFRSTPTIVEWINTHFNLCFPDKADISSGAVSYTDSYAVKENDDTSKVLLHTYFTDSKHLIPENIAHLIQTELTQHPQNTIAILVRSRRHLLDIIPELKKANISFNAVEIESLSQQSIIHDLIALTCALSHLGDRLAWLAVLRAPWCGLTLADLHILAGQNHTQSLWEKLLNFQQLSMLSPIGKKSLMRIVPIFTESIAQRNRLNLRVWIERTWLALNGPACAKNEIELTTARTYFDLLEELEQLAELPDYSMLEKKILQRYATLTSTSPCQLQLMTIHKAKGLEFDTVIIPQLESKSRQEEEQLMLWLDRPRKGKGSDLILAPIKSKKDDYDSIYQYVRRIEKQKTWHEMVRLSYVAATRAKKTLHLIATIRIDSNHKIVDPHYNSFLFLLWEPFKLQAESDLLQHSTSLLRSTNIIKRSGKLLRLIFEDSDSPCLKINSKPNISFSTYTYSWVDDTARHVGIVIHRCLQQISREGYAHWDNLKIRTERSRWEIWLLQSGIMMQALETSLNQIEQAITKTLLDPRGRWILDNTHTAHESEYAVTTILDNSPMHFIIDRVFIDANKIRWIIDYKTSMPPQNANVELFLDEAQRQHQKQLEAYAYALSQLDAHPIRIGLYFPMFGGWREWDYHYTCK